MITVYGDILFAVNFFMDFLLLRFTGILCGKPPILRSILGAMVGAVYATLVFFVNVPVFLTFIMQFLCALVMVAVTFGTGHSYRLTVLAFLGISLFCGGIIFVIFLGGGAFIVNGSVYFSAGIRKLLFSSVGCYYVFQFLGNAIDRLSEKRLSHMQLKIWLNGKVVHCNALCDSGNTLTEPFSGLPVCILEREKYNELCPESEKIYIIPYKTISGDSHVMTGIMPDGVTVTDISGNTTAINCIVAVTDTKIKQGMEAIVSPYMLSGRKDYEANESVKDIHTEKNRTAV